MAASDLFYNEVLQDVVPVIKEYGKEFEVQNPGRYDADKMSRVGPSTRKVYGIIADSSYTRDLIGDGFSFVGQKQAILLNDLNPQPSEVVVIDGHKFPLEKINEVKPADVVLIYILDLVR